MNLRELHELAEKQRQERERKYSEALGHRTDLLRSTANRMLTSELLEELAATFAIEDGHAVLTLHYRGAEHKFVGHVPDDGDTDVLQWVENVDRTLADQAAHRLKAKQDLLEKLAGADRRYEYRNAIMLVDNNDLADDPEIRAVLEATQARILRAEEEVTANNAATREAEIQDVIAALNRVPVGETLEDLRPTCRQHMNDRRVADAWDAANERVEAADAAREEKRSQLELEAFFPFVYYRVEYALVAYDGDESYLDTRWASSLYDQPDSHDWWLLIGEPNPVRLANVVRTIRVPVLLPRDIPTDAGWLTQETEWGTIHLPPLGCERPQD